MESELLACYSTYNSRVVVNNPVAYATLYLCLPLHCVCVPDVLCDVGPTGSMLYSDTPKSRTLLTNRSSTIMYK